MDQSRNLTPTDVKAHLQHYMLVDVREPHELIGPEGHIEGALLVPLGPSFTQFLETADRSKTYVFVCRSGYRSGKACGIAYSYGFSNVYNLEGGMLAWKELAISAPIRLCYNKEDFVTKDG